MDGRYIDAIVYVLIAAAGWAGSAVQHYLKSSRRIQKLEHDVDELQRQKEESMKEITKLNDDICKRLDAQDEVLQELTINLQVLKTTVIGIDGQNGIRGDVQELSRKIEVLNNGIR